MDSSFYLNPSLSESGSIELDLGAKKPAFKVGEVLDLALNYFIDTNYTVQ